MRISDWSSDVCSSDLLIETLAITGVDVADVLLPARDEDRPVEHPGGAVKTQFSGERLRLGQLGGQPHRLFRHTADVDAGATQPMRFEDGRACAMPGRANGTGNAHGSGPADDQVK